jgi:hypothetical protein
MQLYQCKTINSGFVIICPNSNIGQIKTTVNSIKHNYIGSKYICIVPKRCHDCEVKEISNLCQTHRGGDTITSLINEGLSKSPSDEWNFIIVGGSWVRGFLDKKYSYFIESEKDILFPIVNRKLNFVDGSINGILIHKKAFVDIGPFGNDNPLEICKLFWGIVAVEKGYRFKAVLGAAVC